MQYVMKYINTYPDAILKDFLMFWKKLFLMKETRIGQDVDFRDYKVQDTHGPIATNDFFGRAGGGGGTLKT